MTRSQWQTLAELDEILNKAARLTDKSYSIELPHDKGGNLSMNESIELFKKEIITPGIRFNNKTDDQKRVVTPKQAYKNGSDWLVIGRPITKGNIRKNIQTLIDHLSQ